MPAAELAWCLPLSAREKEVLLHFPDPPEAFNYAFLIELFGETFLKGKGMVSGTISNAILTGAGVQEKKKLMANPLSELFAAEPLTEGEEQLLLLFPDPPASGDVAKLYAKVKPSGIPQLYTKGFIEHAGDVGVGARLTPSGFAMKQKLLGLSPPAAPEVEGPTNWLEVLTTDEKKLLAALPYPPKTFSFLEFIGKAGATGTSLGSKGMLAPGGVLFPGGVLSPKGVLAKKYLESLAAAGSPKKIPEGGLFGNSFASLVEEAAATGDCTCKTKKSLKSGLPIKAKDAACPVHGGKTPPGWKLSGNPKTDFPHLDPAQWKVAPHFKVEAWSVHPDSKRFEVQFIATPPAFQFLALELDLGELLAGHSHYLGTQIASIHVVPGGTLRVRFYLTVPSCNGSYPALELMRGVMEDLALEYAASLKWAD